MKTIIEDTRQKRDKHALKNEFWASHEVNVIRSGLPFGDYWRAPTVAVDTKQDIVEMAMNLCGSAAETKRVREEVSSPPGFPVPGILQARTLEWVAISFSNA